LHGFGDIVIAEQAEAAMIGVESTHIGGFGDSFRVVQLEEGRNDDEKRRDERRLTIRYRLSAALGNWS
jgi:hypothetical protein